jgi:hypothetical protein
MREIDDYDLFGHVVAARRTADGGDDRAMRNPHQHRQTGPIKTVERNPASSEWYCNIRRKRQFPATGCCSWAAAKLREDVPSELDGLMQIFDSLSPS